MTASEVWRSGGRNKQNSYRDRIARYKAALDYAEIRERRRPTPELEWNGEMIGDLRRRSSDEVRRDRDLLRRLASAATNRAVVVPPAALLLAASGLKSGGTRELRGMPPRLRPSDRLITGHPLLLVHDRAMLLRVAF